MNMRYEKEQNFISAVVYLYNQEKETARFLERLSGGLSEIFEKFEIICVDDASADGSAQEVRRFAGSHPEIMVSLLHMSFYQGQERSVNAGLDLAIGDYVYEFDSLRSDYPAPLIQDVYFHSQKGFDIVCAAPRRKAGCGSGLFYSVFNRTAHTQYMLRTEAFRLLSRRAISRVHAMNMVIPYRKAVYANCGLKMDTLYFEGKDEGRADRRTRQSRRDTAVDALIMYTDLTWHCSVLFSLVMALIAAGSGAYAVFVYCSGRPVAGWTTTMLILSGGFLGVFVLLTVLIKYVSMILKLLSNRQKYLVESVEKLR